MAHDAALAESIRELTEADTDISERRMFGGVAFLAGGNLALAASGQGDLLVRVDPSEAKALLQTGAVSPMEMRGREVAGWVRVEGAAVPTARQLEPWVSRGLARARSLPARSR